MLTMGKGLGKGLIQIGPDVCFSIKEIAELINEISGKNMNVIYDTTKSEGDRGRCANYSKAKQVLGGGTQSRFKRWVKCPLQVD